jgi:signal transduction histidine kinase
MERVRVNAPDRSLRLPYPLLPVSQSAVSLINNALEASAPGAPVDLALRSNDAGFELRVVDRGSGIRSEILDRVDEPFITTKDSGAGLGLFLTRAVAEHLGGRIVIEPAERGGTCVRLLLPGGVPA